MNRSRERLVPRRASRRLVWAVSLVGLAMAAGALAQGRYGGSDDQAAAPTPAMGASSGVFTAEQAERGAAVFTSSCAGCHGAQLQGGMGPRLNPLHESWSGLSLAALYRFVSQNMPFSAPGSLEPQQYADVISYVLSQNGFPAGGGELPPDAEQLEALTIDAPPAE